MASIRLMLTLSDIDDTVSKAELVDFTVSNYFQADIDDWLEEYNEDNEHQWEIDDIDVDDYDYDYADPDDFDSLDEYGEYVEKCEEHGEAYVLRHADIGDFDFEDSYEGCWSSEEEFVQNLWEECMNVPDYLWSHVDWESVTRDTMMDYSSYDGSEGYHIFRDC